MCSISQRNLCWTWASPSIYVLNNTSSKINLTHLYFHRLYICSFYLTSMSIIWNLTFSNKPLENTRSWQHWNSINESDLLSCDINTNTTSLQSFHQRFCLWPKDKCWHEFFSHTDLWDNKATWTTEHVCLTEMNIILHQIVPLLFSSKNEDFPKCRHTNCRLRTSNRRRRCL